MPLSAELNDQLARQSCAIVVVDMQNDFCHPDGAMARYGLDTEPARRIGPAVTYLIDMARDRDVPRIYSREEHDEWSDDAVWLARSNYGGPVDLTRRPVTQAGSWGAQLYQLAPSPEELVIVKPRHSAFAYTALALALRAKRRDTVILAGVATNICVRATAVDALQQGFCPVLISDAAAAIPDSDHDAAVREFAAFYGPVVTTSVLRTAWGYQHDRKHRA